ncbi:astacin-like metalloendopeptidase [Puntigrus tetrazona]|uniref:astacin-like metalloendopeptidase n=1 Tax=Puntigrus tetrazona TaxID=1606681 RepID=UPI001C8AE7CB|nr:astacin-like metalloendopeptidase [Puntigrus tetrazona]
MLWFVLLLSWLSEVHINSVKSAPPPLVKTSETQLDFEADYAVQEGDILLQTGRNAGGQLWPEVDGSLSVPYEIDLTLKGRTKDILDAFDMISEKTCVKFHRHAKETDYLRFEEGSGCASYVGCIGGEQSVMVGPKCNVGNICHEIIHSLGFHHEHTRFDRDDHVIILDENIISGKEDNFMKRKGNTLGIKYDAESIMHYGSKYFSRNGKHTMDPIESGVTIGQRTHLSHLDVQRIRTLYRCDKEQAKS